jgi:hypothetical protein
MIESLQRARRGPAARLGATVRAALLLALLVPGAMLTAAERAGDAAVESEAATESTGAAGPVAETAPAGADDEVAADPGADGASAAGSERTGNGPSPDVFVPSEEISEDYAVSFPVDI